jgi:hypothetical protein
MIQMIKYKNAKQKVRITEEAHQTELPVELHVVELTQHVHCPGG